MEATNKKSPTLFKEAVIAEAKAMKRKEEIYEAIMKYEEELATLNEVGFVGTFGFANPQDRSNQTTTGFEGTQDISHVNQLIQDMAGETAGETTLESENEALKQEIENLKSQLAESSEVEEGLGAKALGTAQGIMRSLGTLFGTKYPVDLLKKLQAMEAEYPHLKNDEKFQAQLAAVRGFAGAASGAKTAGADMGTKSMGE